MDLDLPPELRERLEVLGELGTGTFGQVFKVLDRQAGAERALKWIPAGPDPRRIARELAIARELKHENVLECFASGVHAGHAYLLMELAWGDLEGLLQLPESEPAWEALKQACRGVAYLHRGNLVHRDLKPENILLVRGVARIADLGLARGGGHQTFTGTGVIMGSPVYMAPEQARGEKVGPAADLFSLGVIAYQIVEEDLPYPNLPLDELLPRVQAARIDPLQRSRRWLPKRIRDAILEALDPDPARRPKDAGAWAERLGDLRDRGDEESESSTQLVDGGTAGRGVEPSTALDAVPASRPGRKSAVIPLAARVTWVVLLLIGLGLAFWPGGGGSSADPGGSAPVPKGSVPAEGLEPRRRNRYGFHEYRNDRDGSVLILVPGGNFYSQASEDSDKPSEPRRVQLPSYLIGKYEVTVAQFRHFVRETDYRPENPDHLDRAHGDLPVTFVSWAAAQEYCRWAGGRLPSPDEWERAAAGIDGRKFPWGDQPPTREQVNYWNVGLDKMMQPEKYLMDVRSLPQGASPVGAHHMAGNAGEWTQGHVLQGGSYIAQEKTLHTWFRRKLQGTEVMGGIGFRLVRDVRSPQESG